MISPIYTLLAFALGSISALAQNLVRHPSCWFQQSTAAPALIAALVDFASRVRPAYYCLPRRYFPSANGAPERM